MKVWTSRLLLAGTCLTLAFLGAIPAGTPARAQQIDSREGIALQNQILELRRDLNQLRDEAGRGGSGSSSSLGSARTTPTPVAPPPPADITTQLLDRVSQLEDEVRRLRGRVDEIDNARQQAEADLQKQIGDINFKLGNGPAGAAAPAAAAAAPRTEAAPPPAAPAAPRTPELILQEGNAALARRDYAAAEKAAREVLAGPKTPRSTDGQYLLAEAFYGRHDYAQAAVAFNDAYSRNRTGNRAQDSLLGLANSLNAIKEWVAACETLNKLHAEFPTIRTDLREAVVNARQRASCK